MIDFYIQLGEIATLLLFPLGQLGRVSFLNQQVSIYPYELCMAFTLLFLFIKYRLHGFSAYKFSRIVYLFFGSLTLSYLLSYRLFSSYENGVGALYFVRLLLYFVYFMFLGVHVVKNRRFKKLLQKETLFLISIIIFSSWVQYLLYPNLRNLLYQGWDPHLYRVFSFFFEPYLAGGALGLSMFYLHFRWKPKTKRGGYLKTGAIFILFLLIMLTFSRTVYLATLLTVGFYFLKAKKPLFIAGVIGLFVVLAVLIPKPVGVGVQLFRTFSIETRVSNALEGMRLWEKQPVFGIGYNRIRYKKAELGLALEYGASHAAANYHSSFVTMLAAGGIVGLLLYGALLFSFMQISTASTVYILFLSIISMGDNALLHPFMMFMLFRLLALEIDQSSLV